MIPLLLGLLDARIATAELLICDVTPGFLPGEEEAVTRAIERRRLEFLTGRACARQAMAALQHPPAPILAGEDRAPIWPDALVGSISHSGDRCAAAVSRRSDGVRSIGIDIEPEVDLPRDILETICLPDELSWLGGREPQAGVLARAIFSIKECVFKCQFPLTRTFIDFHTVCVLPDMTSKTFSASFLQDVGEFQQGTTVQGRFVIRDGFIGCAMALLDDESTHGQL